MISQVRYQQDGHTFREHVSRPYSRPGIHLEDMSLDHIVGRAYIREHASKPYSRTDIHLEDMLLNHIAGQTYI